MKLSEEKEKEVYKKGEGKKRRRNTMTKLKRISSLGEDIISIFALKFK